MGDAAESRETKKTCIVPAIKPFDHYDFGRAKICCSLTWLVAKAYGADSIPADMKEPFYTDQYEQEHMKPAMAELLLSAELYCRAGSLILRSDATKPLLGHEAVIRALAQRGLYVTDQERLVTERDLRKKPIQLSAHLTMIDSLMMAYTMETVSVEKVVSCVRQYASLYPDSDVPYDTEDAVMSWINKVNEYLKDIIVNEQKMRENRSAEPSTGPRARYRKEQALPDQAPWIPPVDNLLKDCADGCALAALLHFYCPDIVKLEDICLKKTMPLADSLYNLQLIQDFCEEYLNRCCHFTVEDMLYTASSIKNNFLVFMAELFWWFEVVKPPFVRPRVLDPEGPELSPVLKSMPSVSISNVTRRSFMEKPPPSDRPSLPLKPQPQSSASGAIARSASMSLADSAVGSWPKEKRSSAQAVSFDIPLDKENTTEASTPPDPEMNRSISTDGLSFKVNYTSRSLKRNLSFQPVNGLSKAEGIDEEEGFPGRPHSETQPRTAHPRNLQDFPNGQALDEHGELVATPSIEEALKIIHNSAKSQNSFHDGQESNGFFLHSQDRGALASRMRTDNGDFDSVSESKWAVTPDTTEVDTGIHVKTEDIQETLDEDSSLRDYTMSMDLDMDHDYDTRACPQDTPSPSTSLISGKSPAGSTTSTSSGVKMTSFAEQKFKKLNQTEGKNSGGSSQKTTPESAEINVPHMVSWAITPQASPTPQSPKDPAQEMASEMVQLKMKLEEKRRAIEAQKKKVEAAFSRHRQRMGRSAFLTVVKNKDDGASAFREESVGIEDGKLSADPQSHDRNLQARMGKLDVPDGAEQSQARLLKSPNEDGFGEADLLEYTKSIEKLNASLNFLQTEMQRLAQQQEVIMQMREQQSWVISPSQPSPQKQVRELRQAARSSGSPSPADSPHITHLSPTNVKKKSASFHLKSQRTPRPIELKITPFSRVLTVPQSVDSLPRLRRFSPSQAQVSSFAYLGEDAKPSMATETTEKHLHQAKPHGVTKSLPASPTKEVRPKQPESTAAEVGSDKVANQENVEFKPIESTVSEVLSQPITETFTITSSGSPADITAQSTSSLIEVPLSVLKPLDGQILDYSRERSGDVYEDDQKMCCGFFFKDDMKGEDDMAVKRAALFEKRLRRERETQQKKQQLEAEMEQKKEEARMKAEEERQKKEDEKARREFIKQEYLRRKQLKLMEDMETVIKARPAGGKQKKPRPRSIHRDSLESPKAGAGSRPRVFSVSSLSLASLNLRDDASMQSDKRSPRRSSLASGNLCFFLSPTAVKHSRSDSADGFLSPCRTGSRNGEREWENASTTSSVTSNTEYTGPKLYKEPSAKSNKHIIQNALSHCCLAGKVNEGQKNKILEEMEKSEANNFLILFRDSGCQFRSLYTYWPEMKEITKLVGIGPKSINRKMIEGLYKYNSDRKQFSHIPAKTMSASVDAITIHGHLWQTKKPVTPKKVSIQS
ncbi:calmodulin-regulated spectrin-associated protein 2a isoform X3 [Brienomyrus brachyistius]|uniref:calmodulin-regulated spectrin-associated protein 2a isoform X3 n=1 Tax=Brienomyrus brachyistius TaxID=42636 RepID=UPI0020B30050|nr:calmodulin-regulated spectrin-associated protein 2a isoform X3 [Brienomyrus brachyistius]